MSTLQAMWGDTGCATVIATLFSVVCIGLDRVLAPLTGPVWAAGIVFVLIIGGVWFWIGFLRPHSTTPVSDLPYEVIEPSKILGSLRSLGKRTTAYVERPETQEIRDDPLPRHMLLIVGPEASGKTRESAEIAMSIARQLPTRARVYLMKRPEVPRETPADLCQDIPILLFDDFDHPWRNQTEGDARKATEAFQRLPELLRWFSQNSHDSHCWIIVNARTEPLERVCENGECGQAAALFHRVDLGPMEEGMQQDYWRSALQAFEITAPEEVVVALATENAGGFRLPYEYLERVVNAGRKEVSEADVKEFQGFQGSRWQDTVQSMSSRQRELLQAMGDLASLGLPLFPEDLIEVCASRRSRSYRLETLRRRWEATRLSAELVVLVRRHVKVAPDGRFLPHDSRVPERIWPLEQVVSEVGEMLMARAALPRLSGEGIAHLRDSLAALDAALYGSDFVPLLVLVNETRAALSQPTAAHRRAEIEKALVKFQALPPVLTAKDGVVWAGEQARLGISYGHLPVGDAALNHERAIACHQRALEVYTREAFPREWAVTQNNLGTALAFMPTRDGRKNLMRAIRCYRRALEVHTREAFPRDWARAKSNLGSAWGGVSALSSGDRGRSLKRAIRCYQQALEVFTREAFPRDWAMGQNNLGVACIGLYEATGGREDESLQMGIRCFQQALEVWTWKASPEHWAMLQINLGNAWGALLTGDRRKNLQRAAEYLEQALTVWTPEAFPREHASATAGLASVQTALRALLIPPKTTGAT